MDDQLLCDLAAVAERHNPGVAIYALSGGGQDLVVCCMSSDREFALDVDGLACERLSARER